MNGWFALALMMTMPTAIGQPKEMPPPTAATGEPRREYVRADWADRLDDLRALFGQNKTIPPDYELEILLALSHYPQLRPARIKFVMNKERTPITSRPSIGSLFRGKKGRVYLITIAEIEGVAHPAYLKNMSFNARIGGIGHELGHTAYYFQKNFFQMAGMGLCFISTKYRISFERDTDQRAIDFGLGWQLFDWAREIRGGQMKVNPNSWLDKFYLAPELVRGRMAQLPIYGPITDTD